ncbi:iron-containing alcohol dehydrogenase family protein [Amycolatopsis sp. CA-230715]|uniref:iron-containing alcohol dehydrogenase family protein n=1 Tax=Amycolatopsis sp. CA-230715 TaxID=2745196 RepID=UPI001C00B556|nr:iron-containing alcohol dehydrogenase [Amycolatopsis sp. CA-230715]QWF83774.1 Alcohol dehydrogenase 2 [Amycolatopsis sp. CA-230715]
MTVARFSVEGGARVEFGPGVLAELPDFVAALGKARAFVVTDRVLRATGIVDRVEKALTHGGIEHAVYEDVGPNPSTGELDRGAARLREFGDAAVVALGGGSALDAAKGISLLAGNPGAVAADADSLWDAGAGLPLVAVPTTAGTGAETNGFGVVEDTCARRKVYIGHSSVRPAVAVLDPELTLGLPARVTASTGIDALVHGIESLSSRGATTFSTAYAAQAMALVSRWLPVAYRDGTDLEARANMLLGAHLAGRALTLSGLGLVHGIGHALTAHTGTPHGVALAAVLEEVMVFNAPAADAAYEQAARAMGVPSAAGGWAEAAIDAVRAISGAVEVKRPLRELGAERDRLPIIAADAIADPVTKNTPRPPDEAAVLDLLHAAY